MFDLPSSTYCNKFIAKNKFFERKKIKLNIKDDFYSLIKRITWKYKLAEETIGVDKTEKVEEIEIFEIDLKIRRVSESIIKIIDNVVQYPVLYVFKYNDSLCYGIFVKKDNIHKFYNSKWGEKINFDFKGINLENIYQNLVKVFIKNIDKTNKDFNDIIDIDVNIERLKKEIEVLKNKIKKAKQSKILFEYSRELNNKKKELNKLLNI